MCRMHDITQPNNERIKCLYAQPPPASMTQGQSVSSFGAEHDLQTTEVQGFLDMYVNVRIDLLLISKKLKIQMLRIWFIYYIYCISV